MDNEKNPNLLEDVTKLPIEERAKYFQEKMSLLIRLTDCEPIPTMFYGNTSAVATMTLIDIQNDEMLAKYGRVKIPNTKADAPPPEPVTAEDNDSGTPPQNPLAN